MAVRSPHIARPLLALLLALVVLLALFSTATASDDPNRQHHHHRNAGGSVAGLGGSWLLGVSVLCCWMLYI